ncbi:MAG: insulinase family protein, partial [Treponema sp.]|nr:insulinase family protein [Treponema sp.]
ENSRPEGRAFLILAVDAGSVLEAEEERGLAHFVEHMAFRGTARFPGAEVTNYLRALGMRFGPEINAHVSFDETVYRIEVPVETRADGRRMVPVRALEMLDDWSRAVSFYPEAVESERLVVIEEYRFRMGARERINRQMFPVLLRGSRYADRLPIGSLEVLENATVQHLRAFYERWYRPENMAVIIVGDFDAAYLQSQLADHFPARPDDAGLEPFYRPRHDLRMPQRGNLETLVLTDAELSHSRVDLYWKRAPQRRGTDIASYRQRIIDNLIGSMLAMRFDEAAARPGTPFIAAGGGAINFGYSSRFYVLMAQANSGGVTGSLRDLLLTRETLSRHGFTQEEKDIAAAALVSRMQRAVSEKDRQLSGSFVGFFTGHFLRGDIVPDVQWELEAITRLLPGITLREINRAVRSYFADDDLTIIITAPEEEAPSLPTDVEIRAMAAGIRGSRIARPVINRARGDILAAVPQPGAIVSETVDRETGAIRWRLSNGAEVILKETAHRNNEISFLAQARGGTLSATEEGAVSAALAADMLSVSGLGSHTRTDLVAMLADRQVSLSFWTQNYLRGFRGLSTAQDIQVLFEMLYLSFTQPRFDPDAVEAALDQRRSNMAFAENDPNTAFRREITRTIHGNPRFHPLELADLQRFDTNEALEFIRRGLNPADYTFVFAGNIDLPVLRSLTETYLASIPRAQAFDEWAQIDPRRPDDDTFREIRMGMEERSIVYLSWFIPYAHSEERASAVSVLNEYLDIRLIDEIREELGGVYTISSWVSISPFVGSGELSGGVFFVTDPGRVDELVSAVRAEFSAIAAGSIDMGVFAKSVEALIQGHEQAIQNNAHIAQSFANSAVIFDSPLSRLNRRPDSVRAVSPADIAAVMGELLGGSLVSLVLLPEGRP